MIEIKQILCPVDLSEFSQRSVDHALAMAKWYEARLTLLYVFVNLPTIDMPPLQLTGDDRERLTGQLRQLVSSAPAGVPVECVIRESTDVRSAILDQAAALPADLLVMGSHGHSGFQRLLLGSVTEKLLRHATCPVLVVPPRAPDADPAAPVRFTRILCPVDFSESSLNALTWALSIALENDAKLALLHVIEMPPELHEHFPGMATADISGLHASAEASALERLRALVPESAREFCTVETMTREGAAYRQILQTAEEQGSDLIVMGVRGRGRTELMLFGSNSARVIRAAACPVLTVREHA